MRRKSAAAAGLSVLAMLLLGAYILAPTPEPTLAAKHTRSSSTSLQGTINAARNVKNFRVWISVRRDGDVIKRAMVPVARDGDFSKPLPRGADRLRIVIREGRGRNARATRGTFPVLPGQALEVTATFPRSGALIPSLFPY